MPYQQNIPRPTDQLNVSQGDIQANFLEIYNWVAVNHGQFDSPIAGLHTQVTLPENAAPTPTAVDQANIYSQLSTLTAQTELAWQRENNGTRIEWTGSLQANDGWTRLPSGILLKWGRVATTGTGSVIFFPLAATIPPFTTLFQVIATPFSGGAIAVCVTNTTLADRFTVNTFTTNVPVGGTASVINYLAIGI
jgi:hypothetical protein